MSSVLRVTNLQDLSGNNIFPSTRNLAADGYYKFPGGAILQWVRGGSVASETSSTVNFPMTFPTATSCIIVSTTNVASNYPDRYFQVTSFTTSSCTLYFNAFNSAGGTSYPDLMIWGY
jgi:hypothetical protein